jgi:hypothetical protein
MKPPLWTSLALVLGLALMLAGPLAVTYVLPLETLWTDADAQRLSRASAKLHAAIQASLAQHESHDHQDVAAGKLDASAEPVPDLAVAQREYDQEQARLDRALAWRNWLWYGASVAGAALASIGVAGHFLARQKAAQRKE